MLFDLLMERLDKAVLASNECDYDTVISVLDIVIKTLKGE